MSKLILLLLFPFTLLAEDKELKIRIDLSVNKCFRETNCEYISLNANKIYTLKIKEDCSGGCDRETLIISAPLDHYHFFAKITYISISGIISLSSNFGGYKVNMPIASSNYYNLHFNYTNYYYYSLQGNKIKLGWDYSYKPKITISSVEENGESILEEIMRDYY